jgi:hypothetical protein
MDYTDDSCMDEFSSNQFERMLAMYDRYRAEDEQEVVANPGGMFIQNQDEVAVVQNPVILPTAVVVSTPVIPPPPVIAPVSTCNRVADGKFCRRDVQCCSGDCYFRKCRPR